MTACNANLCETMKKRQLLAYALSEGFSYSVVFENLGVENAKEFCEQQSFDIYLINLDLSGLIVLRRAIKYENATSPSNDLIICYLQSSFEKVETALD
jgi:hypothetical protein